MDTFSLFGRDIPVYGCLGMAGVVLGLLYLIFVSKKNGKSIDDTVYVYIWACLGAAVGAKLLYIAIEFKNIFALMTEYPDKIFQVIMIYLSSGFVFYGGLIGSVIGLVCASKYFGLPVKEQFNMCIQAVPLIHGFGRIGCCIVGCCYGLQYSGPLAMHYEHSSVAPNGVGLFPVQLCEAVIDFVIFGVFVYLEFKGKARDKFAYIYLIAYAAARFILEFFRGDDYRGKLFGVSTSQYISIAILAAVFIYMIVIRKKVKAQKAD